MSQPIINVSECTLSKLDKLFHLDVIGNHPILQDWLTRQANLSDFETQALYLCQKTIKRYVLDWSEIELRQHFIGLMFTLVDFSSKQIGLFSERFLEGAVDGMWEKPHEQ